MKISTKEKKRRKRAYHEIKIMREDFLNNAVVTYGTMSGEEKQLSVKAFLHLLKEKKYEMPSL